MSRSSSLLSAASSDGASEVSSSSVYTLRFVTSALPFRSVRMPREVTTVSLFVFARMDRARYSAPCTICASKSVTKYAASTSEKSTPIAS